MEKKIQQITLSNKRVFYAPDKYLKYFKENRENVKSVKIRPAKLGVKGFGVIEVTTKNNLSNGEFFAF